MRERSAARVLGDLDRRAGDLRNPGVQRILFSKDQVIQGALQRRGIRGCTASPC